ncbi:MAG TPA: hypothetical protein VMV71_02755 [Candidatus Paceibacterota bacterium]|nr:hypothetical protein [Candidatus Paceibacterota bacterium]
METALIFSETVFYLTVSVAIIIIGALCAIVAYHLIRITRELEELSGNLNDASSEAGERINEIIDRLSGLPVLSYFLKKRSPEHRSKGREKTIGKKQNDKEKKQ